MGKGKKDRMVPIGERAIAWVEKYRDDVRPELATGADEGTLFLTHLGEAFTPNRLRPSARRVPISRVRSMTDMLMVLTTLITTITSTMMKMNRKIMSKRFLTCL